MNVQNRIKEFIKHKKLTITAFEVSIGVSNGYINSMRKSFSNDKFNFIVEIYSDINPEWLLTGKGEMLREKQYIIPEEQNNVVNEPNEYGGSDILKDRIKLQEDTIKFLREQVADLKIKLENEVAEKKLLADIKNFN